MDELINAFKAQMYDKARSPFLSAFAFAWASWNLKTIIVIFSSDQLSNKINAINHLYPSIGFYAAQWLGYPLFSAVIFIVIYPYIARFSFTYWNYQNNRIKEIQVTQDDKVPPSAEEGRRLRKLISDVTLETQTIIDDLVEKNRDLMKKEETINNTIAQLESEKRDLIKVTEAKDLTIDTLKNDLKELSARALTVPSTNNLEIPEEDRLSNFIGSLGIDSKSKSQSEDENAMEFLELSLELKDKYNLNIEQLKIIMYLISSEGIAEVSAIKSVFKHPDMKFQGMLSTLENKDIISPTGYDSFIRLSENFREYAYELGIFDVRNYKKVIDALFI